jgi:hypothetical protein
LPRDSDEIFAAADVVDTTASAHHCAHLIRAQVLGGTLQCGAPLAEIRFLPGSDADRTGLADAEWIAKRQVVVHVIAIQCDAIRHVAQQDQCLRALIGFHLQQMKTPVQHHQAIRPIERMTMVTSTSIIEVPL